MLTTLDSRTLEELRVGVIDESDEDEIKTTEVTFMQYTGLKDKNGKEIYEGDIIVYPCNDCEGVTYRDTYEVIYKAPMFKIMAIKSHIWKSGAEIYLNDSVEVIGNIYENPELL